MDRSAANAIRVWMRSIMKARGWSAEEWANLAETSATNITRFLAGSDHLPSTTTLVLLGRVAGSQPDLLGVREASKQEQQSANTEVFLAQDVAALIRGVTKNMKASCSITAPVRSKSQLAVKVDGNTYNLGGIVPNDMAIIEPVWVKEPKKGSIVLVYNKKHAAAYRFEPPLLVPHSSEAVSPVEIDDVTVLGTILSIVRDFN